MKIIATILLTLLAVAVIAAASIFVYRALPTDSEPDRVVAVLPKCSVLAPGKTLDATGAVCEQGDRVVPTDSGDSYSVVNSRLGLTIRTSKGSTYVIEIPYPANVHVGDPWPH